MRQMHHRGTHCFSTGVKRLNTLALASKRWQYGIAPVGTKSRL
jgi:hypothetical protein